MNYTQGRIWKGILLCTLLFSSIWIQAQNTTKTTTITLDEVAIKASKLETPRSLLPFSVSVINLQRVQAMHQQLSLQEYLGSVPGLFSLNATNYAQDLRISIRGFGARAAFGIRGIKLIVDGIPETTPDGQGQLDNLPLGLLKNIEVLRGPSASLYGNASGGVLYLNTLDSLQGESVHFRSTLGAYGLQSYQLSAALTSKKTTGLLHLNKTSTRGYRAFSALEQVTFNAKVKHQMNPKASIQAQFNYTHSPKAQDAGGLTLEEALENPSQARQRNVDYDTFEKIDQLKMGVRWLQKWRSDWNLDTYAFFSIRDFYGKLPFENGGIVDLYRNYYGAGSRLTYSKTLKNISHQWQLGMEAASQSDQRDRFLNQKGIQGASVFSQQERFDSFGLYVLDELKAEQWLLRSSLRFDHQTLGADTIVESQTYSVLNPSLGFSYLLSDNRTLFFNVSTSYETPALSELSANPSGAEGFNLTLEPSRAINYEMGWKRLAAKSRIEANLFFIKSSNEILPYELADFPGRSFYRNTGATERYGFELAANFSWNTWQLQTSFTQARYRFSGLEDVSDSLKGNNLPGIPSTQMFMQLEYSTPSSWQFQLTAEHIGRLFANNQNTVAINAYQKVRLQTSKGIALSWGELSFFGGVNNLFDVRYYDNIRLNAFGSRHFEPAPGRNLFGGLSIAF